MMKKATFTLAALGIALAIPVAAQADGLRPGQNAATFRPGANPSRGELNTRFEQLRRKGSDWGRGRGWGWGRGNGNGNGNGNGHGHGNGNGNGHGPCKYDRRCHASPG